jgi:hypothetical protein
MLPQCCPISPPPAQGSAVKPGKSNDLHRNPRALGRAGPLPQIRGGSQIFLKPS